MLAVAQASSFPRQSCLAHRKTAVVVDGAQAFIEAGGLGDDHEGEATHVVLQLDEGAGDRLARRVGHDALHDAVVLRGRER